MKKGFISNVLFFCICSALFFSCSSSRITLPLPDGKPATDFSHPSWSGQSNVYEVNLRQFSSAGTITEFQKALPRLKEMGVEILWFMPVTPIGLTDRKEDETQAGSYYAVKNYKEINPEFGTMDDWKKLVREAHAMGFKVITDWVANHSAPDNPWARTHPQFYAKDPQGNLIAPFDWTDVRKLDYTNRELRDSMIAAMTFWVRETGIDGFRCDVAEEVPVDFWKEAITELRKLKHVFMLAEGEKADLHYAGFDATYAWSVMHAMEALYAGKQSVKQFDSLLQANIQQMPQNAYRLFFTTNHDENSWNGTEFEKYGDAAGAFAVFSSTMYQSIPLIYNGQEIPNRKRLKFFVKDPIQWTSFQLAPFYNTLLTLRKKNKSLTAGASFKRLATANDFAIYAYVRQSGKDRVSVVLNLSGQPQHFTIKEKEMYGKAKNVFTKETTELSENHVYQLEPWSYLVYEYK